MRIFCWQMTSCNIQPYNPQIEETYRKILSIAADVTDCYFLYRYVMTASTWTFYLQRESVYVKLMIFRPCVICNAE